MSQSMYYQCHDHEPTHLPVNSWREWRNADKTPREQLRIMAVHRFLRDRGGISGDRMKVFLYEHDGKGPHHANGSPMCVISTEFDVSKGDRL